MKPKKPKTYAELRDIWYAKLERKGFEDIERTEYNLKGNRASTMFYNRKTGKNVSSTTPAAFEAKRDYYLMATHFLNNYTFETKLDEVVWAYHTEGISERNIVKILNKVRKNKVYKLKIGRTIRRLKAIMYHINNVTT